MRHKLMFFLIPAFVLIVGTLFATESRMAGLGFPYGYIKDNSEISVYPGAIHRYKTVVIGEYLLLEQKRTGLWEPICLTKIM